MKRRISWLLAAALAVSLAVLPAEAAYADVPAGSPLAGEVRKAVDYGLMSGYSDTAFGYSDSMTRAQFVTVLDRMLGWTAGKGGARVAMWLIPGAMEVSSRGEAAVSEAYFPAIEEAAWRDVVDDDVPFRGNDPITRGEMSEMLVRALGLKGAAAMAEKENTLPFADVTARRGYIAVAREIGMTNGTGPATFSPDATATRAQAAAMLVRIYEKLHRDTDFVHGFYAISSHSQLDLAEGMDAVSAGWSRMTWDGTAALLSTTGANNNEYAIPGGYAEAADRLVGKLNLSVFMDGQSLRDLLASPEGRAQAVAEIVNELTVEYNAIGRNPYSGVTIDFEGLRSGQKADFTAFLTDLSREVRALDKTLYVCVSPILTTGSYYDGYDYAAIGALADKVILMAYDYDTRDLSGFVGTEYYKTAAPAPLGQVYWAVRAAAEQIAPEKLLLGFSCKNVAWQIDEAGKLVSGTPSYPTNETVAKRLAQADTELGWSDAYQQSYAVYTTEDGGRYFLWYQDSRSVETAMQAAKLLGVTGVSLWRLGNIPQYTFHAETLGISNTWNWDGLLG